MAIRSALVLVNVLSVRDPFYYQCCRSCTCKVRVLDDGVSLWCGKCKKVYNPGETRYRYRLGLLVSDHTDVAEVTVFGRCVEEVFGTNADDLHKKISEIRAPPSLLKELVEICLAGSKVYLGFHLAPPCRTGSQVGRGSPVRLANVISQQARKPFRYIKHFETNTLVAEVIKRADSSCSSTSTVLECLENSIAKNQTENHSMSSFEHNIPSSLDTHIQSMTTRTLATHNQLSQPNQTISRTSLSVTKSLGLQISLHLTCDSESCSSESSSLTPSKRIHDQIRSNKVQYNSVTPVKSSMDISFSEENSFDLQLSNDSFLHSSGTYPPQGKEVSLLDINDPSDCKMERNFHNLKRVSTCVENFTAETFGDSNDYWNNTYETKELCSILSDLFVKHDNTESFELQQRDSASLSDGHNTNGHNLSNMDWNLDERVDHFTKLPDSEDVSKLSKDIKVTENSNRNGPLVDGNYTQGSIVPVDYTKDSTENYTELPDSEDLSAFLKDIELTEQSHLNGFVDGNIIKDSVVSVDYKKERSVDSYTDLPESEDVSAFLKEIENSERSYDEIINNKGVDLNIMGAKVIDKSIPYTELPSSEDLSAFLANIADECIMSEFVSQDGKNQEIFIIKETPQKLTVNCEGINTKAVSSKTVSFDVSGSQVNLTDDLICPSYQHLSHEFDIFQTSINDYVKGNNSTTSPEILNSSEDIGTSIADHSRGSLIHDQLETQNASLISIHSNIPAEVDGSLNYNNSHTGKELLQEDSENLHASWFSDSLFDDSFLTGNSTSSKSGEEVDNSMVESGYIPTSVEEKNLTNQSVFQNKPGILFITSQDQGQDSEFTPELFGSPDTGKSEINFSFSSKSNWMNPIESSHTSSETEMDFGTPLEILSLQISPHQKRLQPSHCKNLYDVNDSNSQTVYSSNCSLFGLSLSSNEGIDIDITRSKQIEYHEASCNVNYIYSPECQQTLSVGNHFPEKEFEAPEFSSSKSLHGTCSTPVQVTGTPNLFSGSSNENDSLDNVEGENILKMNPYKTGRNLVTNISMECSINTPILFSSYEEFYSKRLSCSGISKPDTDRDVSSPMCILLLDDSSVVMESPIITINKENQSPIKELNDSINAMQISESPQWIPATCYKPEPHRTRLKLNYQ